MTEKTLDERTAEAEARKAEAEALAAENAAEKAKLEKEEYESEHARKAREAAARTKVAEARKATAPESPAPGAQFDLQEKETNARKATSEAEKAEADARAAQISSFLPDFTKIETGETTVSGDQPIGGSVLSHKALGQAADEVVTNLKVSQGDRFLITGDPDLATSDAVYLEVKTSCEQLTGAAAKLLGDEKEDVQKKGKPDARKAAVGTAVATAIAGALPGFLSLFSAKRALSSHPVTVDSKAAMAEVARAMRAKEDNVPAVISIDDFRLLPVGQVVRWEKNLRDRRSDLAVEKLELELAKSEASRTRAKAEAEIVSLNSQLLLAVENEEQSLKIQEQIEQEGKKARDSAADEKKQSIRLGPVDQLLTAIDGFLGALHKVPDGQNRSPFALAALREQLHAQSASEQGESADPPGFTRVLYLEAGSGSIDQLVNDKPLWFKDKVHAIGTVSVTYWMLDVSSNHLIASGVVTGRSQLMGSIGDSIDFG